MVLKSVPPAVQDSCSKRIRSKNFHHQHGEPEHPTSGQWAKILSEPKVRKYESTLCRLAFEDHCELCDILFRDVTAMLIKPVIGHSLRELAKFKIPLVGSVRR